MSNAERGGLSAGMFDIGNNVLDLFYIYFGDVCIKVVGQIELERAPKNGSSYDTVLVHKNPLYIYIYIYFQIFEFYVKHFQARSPNCEERLLASSCLSVRLHGTTRLPLNGFLCNMIF